MLERVLVLMVLQRRGFCRVERMEAASEQNQQGGGHAIATSAHSPPRGKKKTLIITHKITTIYDTTHKRARAGSDTHAISTQRALRACAPTRRSILVAPDSEPAEPDCFFFSPPVELISGRGRNKREKKVPSPEGRTQADLITTRSGGQANYRRRRRHGVRGEEHPAFQVGNLPLVGGEQAG